MRALLIGGLVAWSAMAAADAPKTQRAPEKLDRDAHVYVLDKEAPPVDKTMTLARPRTVLKEKLEK